MASSLCFFGMCGAQNRSKSVSYNSLKLPVSGHEMSWISGPRPVPGQHVPRPKDPDILELTIPHRQKDRCITPTRCSPRPVWCLQMRTWDPDWTHHLAKAKQTEKNVGLESTAQRSRPKFLEQNTVRNKTGGVKAFYRDELNAPAGPPTHILQT